MIWKFVVAWILFYGRTVAHGVEGKCLICAQDAEQIMLSTGACLNFICIVQVPSPISLAAADYPTSDYSAVTNSFQNLPILISPYQLNGYLKIPGFRNS